MKNTMINFEKRGGYDHNHPIVNNTTNFFHKEQKFGLAKVKTKMEDLNFKFLHDIEYICTALRNPLNQPKDLPALTKLVELLKLKYEDLYNTSYVQVTTFHINLIEDELKNMSIKLYRYYFNGKEKPVTIEAISKYAADHAMMQLIPKIEAKGYYRENLRDVKVETPIAGVSTKRVDGKILVWTTDGGWIEKREE
jgi:hypothetical protein